MVTITDSINGSTNVSFYDIVMAKIKQDKTVAQVVTKDFITFTTTSTSEIQNQLYSYESFLTPDSVSCVFSLPDNQKVLYSVDGSVTSVIGKDASESLGSLLEDLRGCILCNYTPFLETTTTVPSIT